MRNRVFGAKEMQAGWKDGKAETRCALRQGQHRPSECGAQLPIAVCSTMTPSRCLTLQLPECFFLSSNELDELIKEVEAREKRRRDQAAKGLDAIGYFVLCKLSVRWFRMASKMSRLVKNRLPAKARIRPLGRWRPRVEAVARGCGGTEPLLRQPSHLPFAEPACERAWRGEPQKLGNARRTGFQFR